MKRLVFAWLMLDFVMVCAWAKPKVLGPDPGARVGVAMRVIPASKIAAQRNWRGAEKHELDVTIWYPAVDTAIETKQMVGPPDGPYFEAGGAMPHAPFAPKMERVPMVVMSHGFGGSAIQLAWLGTALARAGYVAVAVDHPGNNSNGPITPEGAALWWERATDLSNVIDAMLADPEFGDKIDATRVAAAGYSMGGFTVMEIAGARADVDVFFDTCKREPESQQCRVPEMKGMGSLADLQRAVRKTSGESLARSAESFRDPRVKAVFAMAPGIGFTQTPESLHAIRVPVDIVVGAADRTAPAKENADYLRANIHGAQESVLRGDVNHYVFLDVCTDAGRQQLPVYCTDGDGVDRRAVHEQVSGMAIGFFDRALKWR